MQQGDPLVKLLSKEERIDYAGLTQPQFLPLLENESSIAIGASQGDQAVGLILATIHHHFAEIHSLFVLEECRGQHIAQKLLTALESTLKQKKCVYLFHVYPAECPNAPALEHLLKKNGWADPTLYLIRCRLDKDHFNPSWIDEAYALPTHFTEFFWRDLKEKDRQILLHYHYQNHFLPNLSPFGPDEDKIEKMNSLGLCYKDTVIGWMITHRTAPDTIRYTALYIQKEWQMSGVAIKLLTDSLRIQKRSDVKWGIFEVNVPEAEPSWTRFVQRHLVPYAQEVHYLRHISKGL